MVLKIDLIVLRCADILECRKFYEKIGFEFAQEKHKTGPIHYAANNYGFVLELYPVKEGKEPDNIRLGFSVPLLSDISGDLLHDQEVVVVNKPFNSDNRLIMVVQDPDGRKLEISQTLYHD